MSVVGLITERSTRGFDETLLMLRAAIARHGMPLVAEIDHAGAAASHGLALRPTRVLVFGNPRGGTPLMDLAPTLAIDLPLKLLVWETADGEVWTAYNDPRWLADRHKLLDIDRPELKAMTLALADIVSGVTRREDGYSR